MKIKKTIALFVTLFSLICALSISFAVSAENLTEGIFTYTVTDDKATVTKIDYKNLDEIRIPETLGGYEVTAIARWAMFDETYEFGDDTVTAVYIPKTVTSLNIEAFEYADVRYQIVDPENPNYTSDE